MEEQKRVRECLRSLERVSGLHRGKEERHITPGSASGVWIITPESGEENGRAGNFSSKFIQLSPFAGRPGAGRSSG